MVEAIYTGEHIAAIVLPCQIYKLYKPISTRRYRSETSRTSCVAAIPHTSLRTLRHFFSGLVGSVKLERNYCDTLVRLEKIIIIILYDFTYVANTWWRRVKAARKLLSCLIDYHSQNRQNMTSEGRKLSFGDRAEGCLT